MVTKRSWCCHYRIESIFSCLSLKDGAILLALVEGLFSVLGMGIISLTSFHSQSEYLAIAACLVFKSWILYHGATREQPIFLLAWLVTSGLLTIAGATAGVILLSISLSYTPYFDIQALILSPLGICLILAATGLKVYFWIGVRSLYQHQREKMHHTLENDDTEEIVA